MKSNFDFLQIYKVPKHVFPKRIVLGSEVPNEALLFYLIPFPFSRTVLTGFFFFFQGIAFKYKRINEFISYVPEC